MLKYIGLSTQLANSAVKVFVTSDGPVPTISTALPPSLTESKSEDFEAEGFKLLGACNSLYFKYCR